MSCQTGNKRLSLARTLDGCEKTRGMSSAQGRMTGGMVFKWLASGGIRATNKINI